MCMERGFGAALPGADLAGPGDRQGPGFFGPSLRALHPNHLTPMLQAPAGDAAAATPGVSRVSDARTSLTDGLRRWLSPFMGAKTRRVWGRGGEGGGCAGCADGRHTVRLHQRRGYRHLTHSSPSNPRRSSTDFAAAPDGVDPVRSGRDWSARLTERGLATPTSWRGDSGEAVYLEEGLGHSRWREVV